MRMFTRVMVSAVLLACAAEAVRQRRDVCAKQDTFFKHKNVYIYQYTTTVSSSFDGATNSKSGYQLTCTVAFKVPKKCKFMLKLSSCWLQELPADGNSFVDKSSDFLQDLERYPVYFQMNKGLIVEESITRDKRETLQTLNIKRGILSSLQFQILEKQHYISPIVQRDILGDCPTTYTFSANNGYRGHTYRDIRQCHLGQIFKKQFNSISSLIRPTSGGYMEGPISEGIYPFVSEINCDFSMNGEQLLSKVYCLQQHYFKPSAYRGDILATAMTNISQSLVLKSAKKNRLRSVDLDPRGFLATDIRFDFDDDHNGAASMSEISTVIDDMVQKHVDNMLNEVPGYFGKLVQLLRQASSSVLEDYRVEVFSCYGNCGDVAKVHRQHYYMDGLHSCGTEECLLTIMEVMMNDHLKPSQKAELFQGLDNLQQIPKSVVEKLAIYCDTNQATSCWFMLGAILSKTKTDNGTNSPSPTDSILTTVLDHIQQVLEDNCDGEGLSDSVREVNTAIKVSHQKREQQNTVLPLFNDTLTGLKQDFLKQIAAYYRTKTLENIGSVNAGSHMDKLDELMLKCLQDRAVPKSVKRSILQVFEEQAWASEYKGFSVTKTDALLTLVEDSAGDTVLRTRIFSLLMKTTDKDIMKRLRTLLSSTQTSQMESFMHTALAAMFENDVPEMRKIKAAWVKFRSERFFSTHYYKGYDYKWSKTINFADFYKLPLTEYFGEQLYIDVVFDPASNLFTGLHFGLNFYYGNEKNPLFDFDLNIHGFEGLGQLLSSNTNLSFKDFFAIYQAAKSGKNMDKAKFAAFQKDIIEAVLKILEVANYPKVSDFDIEVDLKYGGKNILFANLQESIGFLQGLQKHMTSASSTPSVEEYLNKLFDAIEIDSFKTMEFVSLIKVLPTCVGLPMNMSVWAVGQNKIKNSYNLDVKRSWHEFDFDMSTHVTFNNELKGQLIVPFGLNYESGMKMAINIGSDREADFVFAYNNNGQGNVRAELKLFPIPENMQSEKLLHAKGRMFLLHHSRVEDVKPDPAVHTDTTMCMNAKFQMILGRSLCATLQYPDVKTSRTHAYFPLSGLFDIDVTFAKVDGVVSYNWVLETYKNQPWYDKETRFINLIHNAPGNTLGRHFFFNITTSREYRILNVSSGLPALGFEFFAQVKDTKDGDINTYELTEYMWIHKQPVLGYRLKGIVERSQSVEHFTINTNLTIAGVSWDLKYQSNRTNIKDGKEKVYYLAWKWFCSKERSLLYLLHPSSVYAAKNEDVTSAGFKYIHTITSTSNKDEIHLEFYDTVLKATLGNNFETSNRDIGLAYEVNGVETVIIGAGTLDDVSSGRGMFYDYNLNINNPDYNMVMTGSVQGQPEDFVLTSNIEYTKNEDTNVVSRRKRSLKELYQNFVKLEKEALKGMQSVASRFLHGKKPDTDVDITDSSIQPEEEPEPAGQLPNMIPTFPSIWDMPHWNTVVNLNAKIQPKFKANDVSGQPEGMELAITSDITHPWNGGYRVIDNVFKIGKSERTDFRYFWFWIDNSINTSYTAFDGSVIMENGEPLVVKRGGNFNVFRKAGDRFEFSIRQFSPSSSLTYEILFDLDAYGHTNEPLFRVISNHRNDLIPFFNHKYKEFFTLEKDHVKHSANFEHSMLNVSIVSDFFERKSPAGPTMDQSISVSYKILDTVWTAGYETEVVLHKLLGPMAATEVTLASQPDVTYVYKYGIKYRRIFYLSQSIIPSLQAPEVAKWNMELALIETFIQQLKFTWTPAYHDEMSAKVKNGYLSLKNLADNIGENMMKPLLDQNIWFIGATPKQLMKKYVFPRLVVVSRDTSYFMANFVSLEKRQAILDKPGPKVPDRFRQMLGIMKASDSNTEPNSMVYLLQTVDYYLVFTMSMAYKATGVMVARSKELEGVLQRREIIIGWTNFYRINGYDDLPTMPEAIKHIMEPVRKILYYPRIYYFGMQSYPAPNPERLAALYGRHSQTRVMNVMTFDGKHYKIPADYAEACTFLLAADLLTKQFALVMSPEGLTLLTEEVTVTVSYENNIYLDDSKTASEDPAIYYTNVVVKRLDDKITIETEIGVSVECFTNDVDVCIVALKGGTRNTTIGLLGTNDREKFTDLRMLSGEISANLPAFLTEYVVSGPEKCYIKPPTKARVAACNKAVEQACLNHFSRSYSSTVICGQPYDRKDFKRVCTYDSIRCDIVEKEICYLHQAFIGLCNRSGLASSPVTMTGVCNTPLKSLKLKKPSVSKQGSLDVVFVLSDHETMKVPGGQTGKYMHELLSSNPGAWNQFEDIRIGLVGFAGAGKLSADHVIWQKDSYFTDAEDFDWSLVTGLSGDGSGQADGFLALERAASFPFKPNSHKLIILLITKEQGSGTADKPQQLLDEINAKGIVVNVFSTYKATDRRVIGINWEEKVITRKPGYGSDTKALPRNDYVKIIQGTKGTLWDLDVLKGGRKKKVARVVEEFVTQTK